MCGDRGQGLPVESFTLTYAHWFSTYPSNSVSVCLCPSFPSFLLLSWFLLFLALSSILHLPPPFWLTIYHWVFFFPVSRRGTRWREMRVIQRGMKNWIGEGWVWRHAIWLPCGRPLVTAACPIPCTAKLLPGYTLTHTHTHAHTV